MKMEQLARRTELDRLVDEKTVMWSTRFSRMLTPRDIRPTSATNSWTMSSPVLYPIARPQNDPLLIGRRTKG